MEGTLLGAYRIERELGSGGMGTVWLGRVEDAVLDLDVGEFVAIKLIHPHLLAKRGIFQRFLREGEVGRRVRHENVVRTLEVDSREIEGSTRHFLVMEYVEGRTLRELQAELGAVPEALLREIALKVAAGLSAIHEAGIVHRDLKPDNVLLTEDHRVRIMDLGVAKLVEESVGLTSEGHFAGSLHYAAPEQFRDVQIGPAADLYSLGVTIHELAIGQSPIATGDAGGIIRAHLDVVPPRLSDLDPELSGFLSELTMTLLAKRPEDRFESAAVVAEILSRGERSDWWAGRERELLRLTGHLPRIPVQRATKLHGREDALAALTSALSTARRGEGRTVLVEGEAGIGKTRIVDAFMGGLGGEDVHVLYGSYPPSGGFGGIPDALLAHFGSAGLADALSPYMSVTPGLVTAFAAWVRHETPPVDMAPISSDALHAAMVHLVRGLSLEKPVVWVVDDLHFADPESRKVVLSMARAIEDSRVLLLVTARPALSDEEVSHFSRLRSFHRLALGRLSPREVIELLADAFRSEDLARKLGGQIAYKSDGVPFFVFEMIRGLREGQFLSELPDGTIVETRVIEDIEVPSAVRDLIEARLADLTDDERNLLDVASVMGYEFDPDLVARVWELRRVLVLSRLAAIERRSGVVRASGPAYRFDHHQIQEILYQGLSEALRTEYHALLAESLAEREGVSTGTAGELSGRTAHLLASHFLRGNRPQRSLPFLDGALTHLEESHKNDAALDLMEVALAVPELLEGEKRVELLLRLARRLDQLGRRERERSALDEAASLAESMGRPDLRALVTRALGTHYYGLARHEEAKEALTRSLAFYRECGDRRGEGAATGNLGAVMMKLARYEEGRSLHERGLALARETGNRRGEAIATGNLGNVFLVLGRYEEARTYHEKNIALCRELGFERGKLAGLGNLGITSLRLGRFEDARESFERQIALAREIGYPHGEAMGAVNLGILEKSEGFYAAARDLHERVLSIAKETADRGSECLAHLNLASLYFTLGDHPRAAESLGRAHTLTRETGDRRGECSVLALEGEALARHGDSEGAERQYRAALALTSELESPEGQANSLLSLGRLFAETGRAEEARVRLEEALTFAREHDLPRIVALAGILLSRVGALDPSRAGEFFEENEANLTHGERIEAHHLLWLSGCGAAHLDEAHRLLISARDHAPEEFRESMVANVPRSRDVAKAWAEAQR